MQLILTKQNKTKDNTTEERCEKGKGKEGGTSETSHDGKLCAGEEDEKQLREQVEHSQVVAQVVASDCERDRQRDASEHTTKPGTAAWRVNA